MATSNQRCSEPVAYEAESHLLAHELIYDRHVDVVALLRTFQDAKATGRIIIDVSQGGICAVRFRHERRVDL